METSAQSSGDHQEQHVSVQEMQELKETLSQAETKSKSLENQVENLQKVCRKRSERCMFLIVSLLESWKNTVEYNSVIKEF